MENTTPLLKEASLDSGKTRFDWFPLIKQHNSFQHKIVILVKRSSVIRTNYLLTEFTILSTTHLQSKMLSGMAGSGRDPRKRPVVTQEEVTAFLKGARALEEKVATQKR